MPPDPPPTTRILRGAGPAFGEDIALQERGAGVGGEPDFIFAAMQHLVREIRVVQGEPADAGKFGAAFVDHRAEMVGRDEIGGADHRHIDAFFGEQTLERLNVFEIDGLWRVERGADEFRGVNVGAAAGGAEHGSERAVQHRDAERMQARRVMRDEIFDVVATLEVFIAA